jgi:hypothetical protein
MFCFINEDKKLLTRVDEEKIQGEGMLTRDLVMEKLRIWDRINNLLSVKIFSVCNIHCIDYIYLI